MRILQLVNRFPYPLNDGGNLGVYFFTEGFQEAGVTLSMLAMNTTRHWINTEDLPDIFKQLDYFEAVKVDNRIRPFPAFLNLFTDKSYHVTRFLSKEYEKALCNLLSRKTFDIIQLEGLYLMPYIPVIRKHSQAKIVLRQHNAEYIIWERLAQQEANPLKKKYLDLLTRRLKKFETESLNKVDFLLPISQKDADVFKGLGRTKPFKIQSYGLNAEDIPFHPNAEPPICLYHIGAMDWQPNMEAIAYFIEQVMPKINRTLPELTLHLAGRNMPQHFLNQKNKQIIIHGEVPDAAAFEKDKSILVVPLLSGGGIRIKILKAMAMGKAVVSTPVGLEGINIKDGVEAIIADDPEEMAEKIIALAQNPNKILDMAQKARQFIIDNHNQPKLIKELLESYEELIKQ